MRIKKIGLSLIEKEISLSVCHHHNLNQAQAISHWQTSLMFSPVFVLWQDGRGCSHSSEGEWQDSQPKNNEWVVTTE